MNTQEKAKAFAALHKAPQPLVLYNVWDAGTARAAQSAGALAIATGSHSVAEAHGYQDGQQIPLAFLLQIATRIVASTTLPVSIDFEGGFANDNHQLEHNVRELLATGAVGINFEDQVIGGSGLHDTATQTARIATVRRTADCTHTPLFINARTDVFLQSSEAQHGDLVDVAIKRGEAYAAAGADGFFIPGLTELSLIARICSALDLPVNVMQTPASPTIASLCDVGVARISYGPGPYATAMQTFADAAKVALNSS